MLAGKETHDNYVTNVASRICVDDFWDSSSSMQHCAAETAQTGGFLQKQYATAILTFEPPPKAVIVLHRRNFSGDHFRLLYCKTIERFCSDLTSRSRYFCTLTDSPQTENITCQRKLQSITRKHQNI